MHREEPSFECPMAVISDIHSNLPALEAVLADIDSQGVKRVVCLGDVVGYGPDPAECWRLVRDRASVIIRGNHDQALGTREMERFHPRARNAIEWTRKRLLQEPDGEEMIKAIVSLPRNHREGKLLLVHGSPSGPTMDYLLPGDAYDRQRMEREFSQVDLYALNGHSHIPGVIERGGRFMPPEALEHSTLKLYGRKAIINVGSVGQPRDGNPKACYLILDRDSAAYRRVEYDAEETCRRILSFRELDPFLGQRLLAGY